MNKDIEIGLITRIKIAVILFTLIFLGNFFIGPITARNILGFCLLAYSFVKMQKIKLYKIDFAYFIFLLILIICSLLSGVFVSEPSIKILTYHFISISIILSFPIFFNSHAKIKFAYSVLIILYVVNSIISIMQFSDISAAWDLSSFINPQSGERFSKFTEDNGVGAEMLNHSVVTGLFGFVVTNGYFVASVMPLATAPLIQHKSVKKNIISWAILCLGVYTIYVVQQRMGMLIGTLYILLILILQLKSPIKILIASIIAVVILYFGDFFKGIDMGRLFESDDEYRSHYWQLFIESLQSPYALIGGFDLSDDFMGKVLGHNSILDCFRRGGLITMIAYIIIYLYIGWNCIKYIKNALTVKRFRPFGIWCSALALMLYSLTHSQGIQSGDPTFWMLVSLGLSLQSISAREIKV